MTSSVIDTLFDELHARLAEDRSENLFDDGRPIYIYGLGTAAKDIFRLLESRSLTVFGFLDHRAQANATWEGVSILAPDAVSDSQRNKAHVVLGIFNREVDMAILLQRLASLGYGRVTSFPEFYERHAAELGERFWLAPRSFYSGFKEQAQAGYNLWSDDESRKVYASTLRFRLSYDYRALTPPHPQDQYFPPGLPAWPSPMRLIDCGAYDGDTLRDLARRPLAVEAIAAFEPDLNSYHKLAETARAFTSRVTDAISLFPCGVSSATEQIRFSSGNAESSRASEQGESVIQCVSLDDALPSFRPNLIKMDIEGAEPDALSGARRMIEEYQPGLAVCVYHQPEHLWQIPLLAKSLVQGGGHYLRAHGYSSFELVYYRVP